MSCNIRELCYISAGLNLVGNLSGSIYFAVCCFLYDSEMEKETFPNIYHQHGSFRINLFLSICFGIVFYRTLKFIDGLRKDKQNAIAVFIITLHCLMLILALRVYFEYLYLPSDNPFSFHMRRDIVFIIFMGITVIPLYILYNDMKSEFYVPQPVDLPCFRSGHKANVVSTEEA